MKNTGLTLTTEAGKNPAVAINIWARLFVASLLLAFGVWRAEGAPVLNLPASVTIAEDGSAVVTVGVADAGVPIFTVSTIATSGDTNLVPNANLVFNGNGASRSLRIVPGVHASGTNIITVVASDNTPASTTNSFTVNVVFTNYPPIFTTNVASQTNLENAAPLVLPFFAADIQTAGSNLVFTATSTNTSLVANSDLVITNTGTNWLLTVNQETNQDGLTQIQLVVADTNGATATNDFLLYVWHVNQPPTFTLATNSLTYNEYFGPVSLPNFVTGVSSGPPNQASESNWFTLTYNTSQYYQIPPSISANGTFSFEVVTNQTASDTIGITLHSLGSLTNGGVTNLTQTIALQINPIVQPPYFSFANAVLTAPEESGKVTNANFISYRANNGAPSVLHDKWTYTITASSNAGSAAFSTLTLGTNGTLIFQPQTHSYGTNTITVVMTVGPTPTNNWINQFTNTFQIKIPAIAHAPVFVGATNRTVLENATNGLTETVLLWDYDVPPTNFPTNFTLTAVSSNINVVAVAVTTNLPVRGTNASFTLNFTLTTNNSGSTAIHLTAVEGGVTNTTNLTFTVSLVNQAPTFTLAANKESCVEESALVTISNFVTQFAKGPVNQTNQNTETYTYTLTTLTNNPTNANFKTLALSTNGTLTYQPNAHVFGTNLVNVVMTLSGGATNGGVGSATNTFVIDVAVTNHAPIIVGATNRTVLENSASNLTETILLWDYDAPPTNFPTNFNLTAISSNTNLVTVTITTNSVVRGTNVSYTLTFNLAPTNSGTSGIQLVASEGFATNTTNITFTATLINHAPSFTLASNVVNATEESPSITLSNFATNFSMGPTNQNTEKFAITLATVITNATNATFKTLTLTTNGTLTFQPNAHSYGTNFVTAVMTLSGGTSNGGVASATNTFTLNVAAIPHAPVIVGATNRTVLENATSNLTATILLWDYDARPANFPSNFNLTAISTNTNVVTVAVATNSAVNVTNASFTLTFALAATNSGVSTIQVAASEGGLTNATNFTFTVTLVNHAPSFTLASNTVNGTEESALVAVSNYAVFNMGPTNQDSETFTSTLTTTTNATNATFKTLTLNTNGTLTYLPNAHSYGTNLVTAVMKLSGGTNNGGVASATNTFTLAIAAINHAPTIVGVTNQTMVENATNALPVTITLWDYDARPANFPTNFTLTATSSNSLVGVTVSSNATLLRATNVVYTVTLLPSSNFVGVTQISLAATENGLTTTTNFNFTATSLGQSPSFVLATNWVALTEESPAVTMSNFVLNWAASNSVQWGFTNTTVTNNLTNVAFTTLPSIDTNGTLTFAIAPHSCGTNPATVVMSNGTNSFTNAYTIAVAVTNHAPVIVYTDLTINENAATGLTNTILVWDYDAEPGSFPTNITFTATSSSNALVGVTWTTNSVYQATNASYSLIFAPGVNASGTAQITLTATKDGLSSTNVMNYNIWLVNQAPSFTMATNSLVLAENAGAETNSGFVSAINIGPANQNFETFGFTVTNATIAASSNVTFLQWPTIDTNGNLVFTTATNSFGTNLLSVTMTNSGGTSNSGVNSFTTNLLMQVAEVFYPPAIQGLSNVTIFENSTSNLTQPFTLYDPLTTNFTVTCKSSASNVVSASLSGVGTAQTLTFAPALNQYGNATITVVADDGARTNTNSFLLTVAWVNQPPTFNLQVGNFTVDQYDRGLTFLNAATNISSGPVNQSNETVGFLVTNSNPLLFDTQPTVSAGGAFSLTPGSTGGTVTIGIALTNSGGVANGGSNTSPFQTLTVTIPPNAFQYLVGPFAGLFYDTNSADNASSGYFDLTLASNGVFSGYLLCAGDSNTFAGQFGASTSRATATASNYNLSLAIDTSSAWTETITGSVSNTNASWNATLESFLAGYSADFPTSLAGGYLMALPGLSDPTVGPTGFGTFSLTVSNNGAVVLSGFTPDNTNASQTSQISFGGNYPLYVPLYSNGVGGSLMGWLNFTGGLTNAVDSASWVEWIDVTNTTAYYPLGFTNQTTPEVALYNPALSPLLAFTNATVILSGGNLTQPITNSVIVSNNIVTVSPLATDSLTLTILPSTGEINGSFLDATSQSNVIYSVILQNTTNVVDGYFVGTNQVGSFTLFGN